MSFADDFATYIKQLMDDAKIPTRAELARLSGVSQSVLGRWLNADLTTPPEIDSLRKVARPLNVPLLHLMVRAEVISPEEAQMDDVPQPPGPRPTLEDDIRNDPGYDDETKVALIHLLGRIQKELPEEDGRRRPRPAGGKPDA